MPAPLNSCKAMDSNRTKPPPPPSQTPHHARPCLWAGPPSGPDPPLGRTRTPLWTGPNPLPRTCDGESEFLCLNCGPTLSKLNVPAVVVVADISGQTPFPPCHPLTLLWSMDDCAALTMLNAVGFRNCHIQTILPLILPKPAYTFRREYIPVRDGGQVALDWGLTGLCCV